MKFKEIKRNGVFCWSPTRLETSIAIATTNQQFDTNFGTDCKIEIYNLDITKCSDEAKLSASKVNSNSFNCIAWHPNSMICGTHAKTLQVYNVGNEDINLGHETPEQSSSFTCLDLNTYESNSFAAGCDDGSIGIWDLENNGLPTKTMTLSSTVTANESVNVIKWNKQVNSILATASNSNIHVWDIRKSVNSGPIMRVQDNNATSIWGSGPQSLMISRSLAWSGSTATTLILANSNDANPILQLWDLRYATCPLNYFKGGHNRGIVSISWNKYDEELLLSAGKDNSICLWNPLSPANEGQPEAMLPNISNQWISDIEWCKWEPSLFAVSSFDGNTTVYNLTQTNSFLQTNTKVMESFALNSQHESSQQMQPSIQSQPILTRAPKWMKTPCRASWGFGGKLLTYNIVVTQTQTQPPTQYTQHVLTLQQVVIDAELVDRAEKLENALNNGNFLDYCLYKMSDSVDDENLSMAWKLISIHLENDPQKQKENLLGLLGFRAQKQENDSMQNLINLTASQLSTKETNNVITNSNESNETNDFFSQENTSKMTEMNESPKSFKIETIGNSLGTQINKAILNGDLENVIKNCIQNNTWAEAILLCCFVSPEHTASTFRKYFNYCLTSKPDSWSPLLWCIISAQTGSDDEAVNIFQEVIAKVELKYWAEVLAFVIRESENWDDSSTRTLLIDNLAKRLIENYVVSGARQWLNAGMYCYIINADYMNLSKFLPFGNRLDQIELSLILQKCTNARFFVNELTSHYAKLLAIEGKFELALKYIDDIDADLKDRITGNLRPHARRGSLQAQAIVSRPQRPVRPMSTAGAHQSAFQYDSVPAVQYKPPMPAYNIPQSIDNRNISHGYSQPVVPQVPNLYSNPYQNVTPVVPDPYARQNYEDQQIPAYPVTPGWNDPPPIPTSRHNSFNANQYNEPIQPSVAIMNPIPGNTIGTPLPPMADHQLTQQNVRQSNQSRSRQPSQSLPPSEPLSPQNQKIYDAFDRLLSHLQQNPNSQALNIRRKLEDSRVKFEALKAKLAGSGQLSSNTLSGLSDIANAINMNDFQTALQYHTNLVASVTFGETAAFLPAIKVVLHLAQQKFQT